MILTALMLLIIAPLQVSAQSSESNSLLLEPRISMQLEPYLSTALWYSSELCSVHQSTEDIVYLCYSSDLTQTGVFVLPKDQAYDKEQIDALDSVYRPQDYNLEGLINHVVPVETPDGDQVLYFVDKNDEGQAVSVLLEHVTQEFTSRDE